MKADRRASMALCLLLLFSGCAAEGAAPSFPCRVVLEEGEGFTCADPVAAASRGDSVTFYLQVSDGYTLTGADYEDHTLSPSANGGWVLTLHDVRYSEAVRVTAEKSDAVLWYHPNDGGTAGAVSVPVTPSHLRWNTATAALFSREGHTLTGWNTAPDGSGAAVGLGSRVEPAEGLVLYAQWSRWTDPSLFLWEEMDGGAAVTGYTGSGPAVTVPAALGGLPVRAIRAGAFQDADCETAILPDTLYQIEDGAFAGCALTTLYLSDNIRAIGDGAFQGCDGLATLHLNAVEAPVYSGTYYDTFQDKYDRLLSLRGKRKLVLFSGSSTRFGFDCALLAGAFPDYEIVNMGVFAYTNALPQLELILSCMGEGDVLLHCPEFDSTKTQFCTTADLDAPFYSMMESNYDALAALDLRRYTNVFDALEEYLTAREAMTKRSYALSPSDFDEDGAPVDSPSYNFYGDYIVYRPNAATEAPIYGTPVHYTVTAFPKESHIDPLNAAYRTFLEAGVRVYFTYSPRNALALSEDSTPQARAELDRYLREHLCVPIISELEDSLWSGVYLYGTDNHLSTEGAALHTQHLIPLLRAQMERDGEGGSAP